MESLTKQVVNIIQKYKKDSCLDCMYNCVHNISRKVCWNCYCYSHLSDAVLTINDNKYIIPNEEIQKKIPEHIGYILCYDYTNKTYQLFNILELLKNHEVMAKHIINGYLYRKKKYTQLIKISENNDTYKSYINNYVFTNKYNLIIELDNTLRIEKY